MHQRIRDLAEKSYDIVPHERDWDATSRVFNKEKFAELLIQDCADFVRETYDHESAETIAWTMEVKYGLHRDY